MITGEPQEAGGFVPKWMSRGMALVQWLLADVRPSKARTSCVVHATFPSSAHKRFYSDRVRAMRSLSHYTTGGRIVHHAGHAFEIRSDVEGCVAPSEASQVPRNKRSPTCASRAHGLHHCGCLEISGVRTANASLGLRLQARGCSAEVGAKLAAIPPLPHWNQAMGLP